MVYFQAKNPDFGHFLGLAMEYSGIFYDHLGIFRLFSIFYGTLVNFIVI
jgi:hypothetical protein